MPKSDGSGADLARTSVIGTFPPEEILEAIPTAIVVAGAEAEILYANGLARELLGRHLEDVRGMRVDAVLTPVDGENSEQRWQATCRRPDGSTLEIEVFTGQPYGAADELVTLILHDVTGNTRSDGATLDAGSKLRAVIEQISAITYTWSWRGEDYEVLYCSPQIETILGFTPTEWMASPTDWYEWVHPEDRDEVISENKRCERSGEPYSLQYRMLRKDGELIWVEDSWVVVDVERDRRVFQGVVFDITERKRAESEIAFLAQHDRLTGLPNRGWFEELLEMAISRARRHDLGVGVLFLDLDNFKLVNDSLGHHAGDELLVLLAERLRLCTRDTDLVARQGGDEFLMLIADLDRETSGSLEVEMSVPEMIAQRIKEALREPFELAGTAFYASGSVGISVFPQDALDADALLKNADAAMYRAKKGNPGGHVMYAAGEDELITERLSLSTRLRRAVDTQSWILHYQPILDLGDGRMVGVEALIRWREPNGGLVAPGEFIPLAEELGLIEAIGEWVIDEMARQSMLWSEMGLNLDVSFNLSPRQLWSAHLSERVMGKLRLCGVDPRKVTVEITESTAMAEPDRTQKILAELHSWGLTLAIDDFGTGYSSLARLQHMPVDILKIDRAFIRDVDKDTGQAGMVRAMIQLAQSLDMVPLAEGIETHGEYVFLRSNGCRLAQGFLFSRPVPASEIPALAAREG
ncbi:MAG: EAL domain-containing protein, partial [Actinomycetota bacterium]|nr:EAL domain-containing protein [Actinomycetota bacterium]